MLQYLIVGLIVAAALLYSTWVLLPSGLRAVAAARLAGWAARCGMAERRAERLQSTLAKTGACSECAQCKGCASAKPPTARS